MRERGEHVVVLFVVYQVVIVFFRVTELCREALFCFVCYFMFMHTRWEHRMYCKALSVRSRCREYRNIWHLFSWRVIILVCCPYSIGSLLFVMHWTTGTVGAVAGYTKHISYANKNKERVGTGVVREKRGRGVGDYYLSSWWFRGPPLAGLKLKSHKSSW